MNARCLPLLALIVSLAGCVRPFGPCYGPTEPDLEPQPGLASDATSVGIEQPFFRDQPRWRTIYKGIDYAELATDVPRELVVQILRIDSTAQGLELVTTPSNGDRPLETDGQTTRAFLEEHGLAVAINTHFFTPCCNRIPGEAKDLIGVSIAQGETVSLASPTSQRDAIYFTRGSDADETALAAIPVPAMRSINLDSIAPTHAIAGRFVLTDSTRISGDDDFSTARHPRTLVGLGDGARTIYLVTIDGRQPGFSTGASFAEAAAILHFLGAEFVLNVDGGGSTTMIIRDPDGASQLANSPSGGAERIVGSNLGFRALRLEPASDGAR